MRQVSLLLKNVSRTTKKLSFTKHLTKSSLWILYKGDGVVVHFIRLGFFPSCIIRDCTLLLCIFSFLFSGGIFFGLFCVFLGFSPFLYLFCLHIFVLRSILSATFGASTFVETGLAGNLNGFLSGLPLSQAGYTLGEGWAASLEHTCRLGAEKKRGLPRAFPNVCCFPWLEQ